MTRSPAPDSASASPAPETTGSNISNEEAIRRLRAKGQPIRLFGESDRERRLRLRALELIEERDHDKQGGQNDFKKALEDVEMNEREKKAKGKEERKKEEAESSEMALVDLELVTTNPDKLYPLIYYALKRTLKERLRMNGQVSIHSIQEKRQIQATSARSYQTDIPRKAGGSNAAGKGPRRPVRTLKYVSI